MVFVADLVFPQRVRQPEASGGAERRRQPNRRVSPAIPAARPAEGVVFRCQSTPGTAVSNWLPQRVSTPPQTTTTVKQTPSRLECDPKWHAHPQSLLACLFEYIPAERKRPAKFFSTPTQFIFLVKIYIHCITNHKTTPFLKVYIAGYKKELRHFLAKIYIVWTIIADCRSSTSAATD